MLRFLSRRLVATCFLVVGVFLMTFALARLLPGDPARLIAGARASPEAVAAVRERLGIDAPVAQQFVTYLGNMLEGDFGRSIITRRPISEDMLTYFPATLELVTFAALVSLLGGVLLGTIAAVYSARPPDMAARGVAVVGLSGLALIFQLVFFATFGLAPFGGRLATGVAPPAYVTGLISFDSLMSGRLDLFAPALHHMILPVAVLSIAPMAVIIRVVRTSMIEVLSQDYIRTARAKGISPWRLYTRHALGNSMLPIVTVFGLNLGLLISGTVFVELIYDWPGLGRYTANAIAGSDYNAIMAITLVISLAYTLINFLVDLSYSYLDPRVRLR